MSLYKESDKNALIEKLDLIMKDVDDINAKRIRPTVEQLWEMIYIVRDFVIEKKRKVYGGFALNKLIESIEPKDKFYQDDDVKSWDIDFYSPTPIDDAKEIAKRLHAKGFCHIQARMAQHEETYTVFAETNNCADISYVPRNIYNRMPFKEISGMYLTGPHFMMIDYFRVLTDPLTSYHRLDKTFLRLCLMMKHFPLPRNTSSIDIIPPDMDLDVAFRTVHDFLINRETIITVGMYAYNHLVKESGVFERNKKINRGVRNNDPRRKSNNSNMTKIDFCDVNYYEIISTNYKIDTRDLILFLRQKFPSSEKITYRESYPFFQFIGFGTDIYCDQEIICRVYHYNYKCTPFFDVPAYYFTKSRYDEQKGIIKIGTVAVQMMYNLINIIRARTNNDKNTTNLYYTMISHIIEMKDYYFNETNKTIFDKSLFQEFVLKCIGFTNSPQMEKALRIEKRIKAGKRIGWSYNPTNDSDKDTGVYFFKNSSGNPINKDRNKKIDLNSTTTCPDEDNINVYEDEDESQDDSDYKESGTGEDNNTKN
jgi:hypothetical protein